MSKELFTKYYRNNSWQGKESVSGPGSDYEQTKFLIPELQIMLKDFKIKSILDVPCGDFNWMKQIDLHGIKYIGGDIVDELIIRNNKKYKSKNVVFESIDIVNDALPKADMVMVRDCLVHLPTEDVFKALNNIRNSGSKYIFTTNFLWKALENNKDIPVGGWRRLNLREKPFNFPIPEHIVVEGNIQSNDRDKTMSLWKISDMPEFRV